MIPPRIRASTHGTSLRFACAWPMRDERGLGQLLHSLMQWLPQVDGLAGRWSTVRPDNCRVAPCTTADEVGQALDLSRTVAASTASPGRAWCAYQSFFLGPLHRYRASLRVELWHGSEGEVAPNQLQLVIHPAIDVTVARQIMLGLVGFLKPAWAAVGPEERPPQTFDPAQPAVGWLTYLSSLYRLPQRLPPSAEVSSMKSLGVLIQALPGGFDANDALHLQALRAVERALAESSP
jgi:hypothetical protein